ncbi:LacI family transcriptional regulator [Massilia sp. Dwa41.01b]|uniref:LacI family DNA-binding transcriptional regulator n=1 Tax=unclassified Massilia TaxID=2609279 RepID=UPI001601A3F4|nr:MULTISPECIES: LacI family DNA-binding transcriptional regulator [unclassified Massilia]QNA89054.1 LacI family transcriptional regulator [Massilia sp. Dwa41.01b]QNA99942.1 LacI family transcriptional regulator [Massilia sp. Se16.2.3]
MKTDDSTTTLYEVASIAGVSPATVSRFLNGTAKVSDDKRRTIERVIEELNYKPNRLAQSLKMGSTRTIGVLTQSLESGYFNQAMIGIEDAVKGSGYALLIMSGHWHADEEAERVELLIGRRVDGVVILTGKLSDEQIRSYSQRVPIVAFGRKLAGERLMGFSLDNYRGACDAVEHLVEQGHRRIAFIAGPEDHEDARARLAGYRDTLARHKIDIDPNLIVPGDFHESGGLLAVNGLLASQQRFTAIFASNDLSAYGARLALYRRNIRVPEDISIVGFDDLHSSMYTTPPLTTVRQPLYDVGMGIGRMMLGMVGQKGGEVELPSLSLVVRESVRRIA